MFRKIFYIIAFLSIILLGVLYYKERVKLQDLKTFVSFSVDTKRYNELNANISKTQKELLAYEKINGYYPVYSKYEFGYFTKIYDWLSVNQISKGGKVKILDVGCAYGTLLFNLRDNMPDASLYCLDFMDGYFPHEVGNNKNVAFAKANAELEALPYNEKFDVIILTEVLEHFNYNSISTLKKLKGALKEDGVLYLSTPDSSSGWGVTKKYYSSFADVPTVEDCLDHNKCTNIDDHVWQYNLEELMHVINASGFKVKDLEYTFSGKEMRHFNLKLMP